MKASLLKPYRLSTVRMSSQLINPSNVHSPRPTYSHIQKIPISSTSTLISIAGQIGLHQDRTIASTFAEQVDLALANLEKCLEAAGATPKDIIKVTQFVVNLDANDKSRSEKYLKFIGDHRPPSTLLGVAALAEPALFYEIEAMAVVHER